jgi:outer membrane autotransporter protein
MKKLAIIAVLAAAVTSASALEVGVVAGRNFGSERNGMGVTLGQKFGDFGLEGSLLRSTTGTANVNLFGVTGSYDLYKNKNFTVMAKAGGAFIDPNVGVNGYAGQVGLGVAVPVAKNVSLTADYAYQWTQGRISAFEGNVLTAGVKYSF